MNKSIGMTLAVMTAAIAGTFAPQLLNTAFAQVVVPPMPGINIGNLAGQVQSCVTGGSGGGISGASCSATHSSSITNGGGNVGQPTGAGINLQQSTAQVSSCATAGGSAPVSGGSCSGTSTQTTVNNGGNVLP